MTVTRNPIPHNVMLQSFFWTGTPRQVAMFLSHWYECDLRAVTLLAVWEAEAETNVLLRQERPANGFGYLKPDETALLTRLLRAAA